jgi:hypothetical protein
MSDYENNEKKPKKGELIVINVDLGARGHQVIQGLSNQDPYDIAYKYCKKNRLGPKTREKICELLCDKMN